MVSCKISKRKPTTKTGKIRAKKIRKQILTVEKVIKVNRRLLINIKSKEKIKVTMAVKTLMILTSRKKPKRIKILIWLDN